MDTSSIYIVGKVDRIQPYQPSIYIYLLYLAHIYKTTFCIYRSYSALLLHVECIDSTIYCGFDNSRERTLWRLKLIPPSIPNWRLEVTNYISQVGAQLECINTRPGGEPRRRNGERGGLVRRSVDRGCTMETVGGRVKAERAHASKVGRGKFKCIYVPLS